MNRRCNNTSMVLPTVAARSTLLAMCLAGLIVAGCGPSRPSTIPASGQVLLDDKPVNTGWVRVIPENGRAAIGKIDASGRFVLTTFEPNDGCLPGTHAVEVIVKRAPQGEFDVVKDTSASEWIAPKRYGDIKTSGLKVAIDKPTDSLTLRLTLK